MHTNVTIMLDYQIIHHTLDSISKMTLNYHYCSKNSHWIMSLLREIVTNQQHQQQNRKFPILWA